MTTINPNTSRSRVLRRMSYRRHFLVALRNLEPLWVIGVLLSCLFLWDRLLNVSIQPRNAQWVTFILIGALFPFFLLLIVYLPRFGDVARRIAAIVKILTLLLGIFFSIRLVLAEPRKYILVLAALQLVLMYPYFQSRQRAMYPLTILGAFIVATLGWLAATRLLWWASFDENLLFAANYMPIIILLVMLLVIKTVSMPSRTTSLAQRLTTSRHILTVVAVILIGLVSMSTDGLFNGLGTSIGAVHHWGVFVGPAELVRQGGWLLWDVPSQYGFLSILAIASLPVHTTWQAMYLLNSMFIFVAGCIVYLILRRLRDDTFGWIFATATSLTTVFFLASFAPLLYGPQMFPSVGPFRFIWCYVLLALIFWEYHTREYSRSQTFILIVGNLTWLLSVLWSVESAFYCTVIWLPAYVLIVARRRREASSSAKKWVAYARTIILWLAVPTLLLLSSISIISLWYKLRLGHLPDWRTYIDYALAFSVGSFSSLIDRNGPVWSLIFVVGTFAIGVAYLLRGKALIRASSVLISGWAAVCAVSSYFVGRADPSNILRVTPFLCLGLALILYLVNQRATHSSWQIIYRVACVPLFTVLLVMPLTNETALNRFARAPQSGLQYKGHVERLLPDIDPTLLALFNQAGIQPSDPIIFAGDANGSLLTSWPSDQGGTVRRTYDTRGWLPTPFTLVAPLPAARQAIYMSRFVARAKLSGWFIQHKDPGKISIYPGYGPTTEFFNQLLRTHLPTKVIENDQWQAIWFAYQQQESPPPPDTVEATKEIFYEGIPRDLLIDGQSQQAGTSSIIATHGSGWYLYNPGEGRWAQTPAAIHIYSPTAHRITMQATPFYALSDQRVILSPTGILQISTNGAPATRANIQVGSSFSVDVDLKGGWNTIVFALEGGNIQPSAVDPSSKDTRLLSFGFANINIITK